MALSALEVVAPVAASVITALGTIVTFRWQEETKRKQHDRDTQLLLWQKVDEVVDERVAEIRKDRDEVKKQLRKGQEERERLFSEQSGLKESNAILKSTISDLQLQREQAINRMRRELNSALEKNTVLFARNADLEAQILMLQQENALLLQELSNVQQREHQ